MRGGNVAAREGEAALDLGREIGIEYAWITLERLSIYCREAGMLIGVGGSFANVVRLQPPLVLNEDEAAQIIDTLSKVLRDLDASL